MNLALDLPAQLWPLLDLILAIFQPAFLLLLCSGVVVASTHLLAMLGTQWGNRQVTAKALIFSLAIHASLIIAVIAMIPEYRPQSIRTAFEEEEGVDVTMDAAGDSGTPGSSGASSQSQAGPFSDQNSTQGTSQQPWDKIPTALAVTPERSQFEVPAAVPGTIAPMEVRPPRQAVSVPDPVFIPLPPTADESGELAKADLPHEYNPASFQPAMDVIEAPRPAAMPSRSAPAIGRSVPAVSALPTDNQLSRVDRPVENPLATDINPDAEPVLPVESPDPDADLIPALPATRPMASDQAAPFQVTDTNGGPAPPLDALPPQAGSPDSMPARSTPRPFPGSNNGLAKIERGPRRGAPGLPSPISDDLPRSDDSALLSDSGVPGGEALPELMRPQGLLPMAIGSTSPAQYQLRSKEQRGRALQQFGGTAGSEASVDLALAWLASIQDVEGFWDGDAYGAGKVDVVEGVDREFAGRDADTGLTALAILAFLGKENTLEVGEYSQNVTKALRWLVYQQGKSPQGIDGYLGGNAGEFAGTYSHAMATFAIAEAYAMTKDPETAQFLLEPLQKAVRYTLLCQLEDGGWRYKRGQQGGGDMSIFGWQLMALKSAQAAGLEIPIESRQKMILFLQQRGQGKSGGLAAYLKSGRPTVAMTAESLFCKQMLGLPREHPSCDEAVNFLLTNPPGRQSMNLYTWYYSTLALYQYGGEPWENWNGRLRDLLISEQVTSGEFVGSWEPRDQWGGYGGRIYATAFATLTLEVYYRYLPLYRTTAPAGAVEPQDAEPVGDEALIKAQ